MERLTERNDKGQSMCIKCGDNCEYYLMCLSEDFSNCPYMDDVIEKLCIYEDTGFELEKILTKEEVDRIINYIEELKQYKDLEKQGLLIRPCYKIDDEFFINIQSKTYICKISGFFIDKDETKFLVAFQDEDNKTWFEIGETHKKEELYLTKEEAEKELERLNKLEV